eukprot:1153820-Amorphochlora_amoeboformis.AAC.1
MEKNQVLLTPWAMKNLPAPYATNLPFLSLSTSLGDGISEDIEWRDCAEAAAFLGIYGRVSRGCLRFPVNPGIFHQRIPPNYYFLPRFRVRTISSLWVPAVSNLARALPP